jgi:VWFA-related protein
VQCHFSYAKYLVRAGVCLFAVCAIPFVRLDAQEVPSSAVPTVPSKRIDLAPFGYRVPSHTDRLSENEPSVSLNFVDADHVLLTFNRKKLWQRLPGCTPDHEDRLMHAAIVELSSGKIVSESDWYLHDRRRYLWPLGSGKFLLRKQNDLYLVDSNLHEKLLFHSPDNLLWVSVTPDASQIVIETSAPGNSAQASALKPAVAPAKYQAQFLDSSTLTPLRTLPLKVATNVTGTSAGYADFIHKGDLWLVRFGSDPAHRRNLARVRSLTVPTISYASNNSVLLGRCSSPGCDYSVTAFSLTGHRLWREHWPRYRYFPEIAHTVDNSRFAASTLTIVASAIAATLPDPDDALQPDATQRDVFQQEVQVFETASGTSVFSLAVSPAMMTGENAALSPDGLRLAVLQGPQLELFDLPPSSEQEQVKFAALKSDTPDSYALGSAPDAPPSSDSTADSNVQAASAEAESAQPESQAASESPAESGPSAPAAPSPAPTASPSVPPVATIRVSAKAVAVDVVVTDSKGRPVKGLHPQDFQVMEDGKLQNVHSFREFTDGNESDGLQNDGGKKDPSPATTVPSTPTTPAKTSRNVFSNQVHAPDPGAVTLVLFDMLNTPMQDQTYARQQLIKFLQNKPKNLQFALCTMSVGSRLRLIQGFTPDETLLVAAAKGKRDTPKAIRWQISTQGVDNAVDTVGQLAAAGRTSGFQGLLSALQETQVQEQVSDTGERAGITVDSMMVLARYLSGIPGRKNIVWLSGSFPISIAASNNSNNPAVDNPNYTYKIKRVTNLLAEAQVAVYPVDVRGLIGGGLSADTAMESTLPSGPQDLSAASVISPIPAIPQSMQDLAQEAAERDTLIQFATATGGRAFYNTNGIRDAIATAAQQGSNYYALSYSPANKIYDGKFRKIKVQLAEKGYSLHYRQGYYADDFRNPARDAEMARRTRVVAMLHGSPLSHQLAFSVRVDPVGGKKKLDRAQFGEIILTLAKVPRLPAQVEAQHYRVDYTFAGSELRFVPLENASYRNTLTLMVASFDRDGNMLTGVASAGTKELQPEAYEKVIAGEFGVQQEIDVPVEAVSIRLGIQDQMSNRLGTVDVPLPVPPDPDLARRARNSLPEIEPD